MNNENSRKALLICVVSFLTWGMLAIYWSELKHVHPLEIVANRALWSLIFAGILVIILGEGLQVAKAFRTPRLIFLLFCSSITVACNWSLYIWAVTSGHIVETSMGYYINPLLNVAASAVIFKVPLNKFQITAILLATIGVANMIIGYGSVPYLALGLAVSFCIYGIIRKIAPIGALSGLFIETTIIAIPSIIFIAYSSLNGTGALLTSNAYTISLLMLGGVVTTLPLVGFAYGAKHLNLSTVGVLQYISPTTSFLIGVFIYKEIFTTSHLITFSFIWAGLIIYTVDSIMRLKGERKVVSKTL